MTDTPAPRHDGWTPARQRVFLDSLAAQGLVRRAATAAGMSHEAAYRLRHRREGAAFRVGWDAALLLARAPLADRLMERALERQDDVIVRDDDGRTRTRTRHDNRLALALLSRLDRFADEGHVAHSDARAVAGAWAAFLDLIEAGADAAALGDFLDTEKRVSGPCQLREAADEPDERSADPDQWLHDAYHVWWSEPHSAHRTNYPPPPGFAGDHKGNPDKGYAFGNEYERSLSALETERHLDYEAAAADEIRAQSHILRKAFFGIADAEEAPAPCSDGPHSDAPCSDAPSLVS